MRKHLIIGLTALLGLFAIAAASRADVYIHVPFVTVRVGDGVYVRPPLVGPIIVGQPPIEGSQALPPPRVIGEVPPTPAVVRVPTLDQFAASFKPAPGKYEVTVVHPVTGDPVKFAFTLPEGNLKAVHVRPREIDFEYARTEISIRFIRNGSVRVTE
jgi:hypothetical protein